MDRHLQRENKNELMTQLLSPNKKMKLESNFKSENSSSLTPSSTSSTPIMSPVAGGNINNYTMLANNTNSLWGGFPLYSTQAQATYQPVYPGMVPTYLPQNVSELHNVMKIGECSIKPLGQQ